MRGCKKGGKVVESAASNQELFVTNGTGIKTNTQKYYIKTFPTCRKRGKLNCVFFPVFEAKYDFSEYCCILGNAKFSVVIFYALSC